MKNLLRKIYRSEPELTVFFLFLIGVITVTTVVILVLFGGHDDPNTTIECVHIGNNACFPLVVQKEK